jgi:tetratricopeptide (TPR) repeat protein
MDRYEKLGDLTDLDAAFESAKKATSLTPKGHPNLPAHLHGLAYCYTEKYLRYRNTDDLDGALSSYRECLKPPTLRPVFSWDAALQCAYLAKEHRPSECLEAYSNAFSYVPDILWSGSSLTVNQESNNRINLTDATSEAVSACIDLKNFELAVELVEQGLGTTFQQMLQLKTNVDHLPYADAEKFRQLSSQLYGDTSGDRLQVAIERDALIANIRRQPGNESFLRPQPYKHLRQASKNGPIVILNSHFNHFDALIILHSEPRPLHIPLPDVTVEKLRYQKSLLKDVLKSCNVRSRESESTRLFGSRESFTLKPTQECFEDLLSWLWACVVSCIYKALEDVSDYMLPTT